MNKLFKIDYPRMSKPIWGIFPGPDPSLRVFCSVALFVGLICAVRSKGLNPRPPPVVKKLSVTSVSLFRAIFLCKQI